jgi:glucose-1-phosphate adenylyltransferase
MQNLKNVIARTQTFVLAGGKGERLGSLTTTRPKPVVAFGENFRIIDFTLSNALHSGLRNVSLLTQYRRETLSGYIQNGWDRLWKGLPEREKSIECLAPSAGRTYLGTAEAVFQNFHTVERQQAEFVVILSGDHVYHMDYRDLLAKHIETQASLTIATVPCTLKEASSFGIVETNNQSQVVGFEEKPSCPRPLLGEPGMALASMGVYVFTAPALKRVLNSLCASGSEADFGRDIIPSMISKERVFAYDFRDRTTGKPGYWRDIGTIDSYYRASMDLTHEDSPFDPFANDSNPTHPTRHPALTGIGEPVPVSPRARVRRSIVSEGVHIGEGAEIEDCVLLPGAQIGRYSKLRRVIVDENTNLPARYCAGWNLEQDREFHTVTSNGVVLVANASRPARAATASTVFAREVFAMTTA